MKQIKHLKKPEKAMKIDKILDGYSQGVTQRLLDKYKHSKKFAIIDGKDLQDNEPQAA